MSPTDDLDFETALAREHAAKSFADPTDFDIRGPRTPVYALAALRELERLQKAGPPIIGALLDGGGHIARQLNSDSFQGFREVVQNADDLGARLVRFGVRAVPAGRQLLIVHDGAPVELMHVIPMIYPAISTRRRDARAKGRFGVGLKTLARLGERLTVHSVPYHFTAENNFAVPAEAEPEIPGFYAPDNDTLITLELSEEGIGDILEAFEDWASEDLVFLDSVRTVEVIDLTAGVEHARFVVEDSGAAEGLKVHLDGNERQVGVVHLRLSGRDWIRYSVEFPVREGLKRTNKATADFTRVALAAPLDGQGQGVIHVALPTQVSTSAPFSIDAQFNPATSREDLSNDPWNDWLIDRVTEFSGALAIALAQRSDAATWLFVPIQAKASSTSPKLNARFADGWATAVQAFAEESEFIGSEGRRPLSAVAYADAEIEHLLDQADYREVAGAEGLPTSLRDVGGRWRMVLDGLGRSPKATLKRLMEACDRPLRHRGPSWFFDLALRCVTSGEDDLLFQGPWLPLENGERTTPQYQFEASELLTFSQSVERFAVQHKLCRAVDAGLLAEALEPVQEILKTDGNLLEAAKAGDIIRAFTARYTDEPLTISREDLVALRDLLGQVGDREAGELGPRVGDVILIEAYRHEAAPSGATQQVKLTTKPADTYLPSAIEDETFGWSKAAGETLGLVWASNAYASVFKTAQRRDGAAAVRRTRGAKRFLTLLGAHVAPRLDEVDTPVVQGLPKAQWAAPRAVGRTEGFLRNDLIAPDLERVVADILATRSARLGRKGQRRGRRAAVPDRAVALYRALASHWDDYDERQTVWARRASGRGGDLVKVPATWIVRLADTAWMRDGVGQPRPPRGLAIATPITEAMDSDLARFAEGLTAADAISPLARALCMAVDPPTSELVGALERHRDDPGPLDVASVLKLYRALAGHIPQSAAPLAPEARIGDMTISALRAKFGIKRSARGLISGHVTTAGGSAWLAPTAVFVGKDIFHGRKPFVLQDRVLQPLWRALNIGAPTVGACVRELTSIAETPPDPKDEAMLIDIYRHLNRLAENPTSADRSALSGTPVKVGPGWSRRRPIYISDRVGLTGEGLRLWSGPCAPHTVARFCSAADIRPLHFEDAPGSDPQSIPDDLQLRFEGALRILQADLARDDEVSYRALEPWPDMLGLQLNIHAEGALLVRVHEQGPTARVVSVRDHTDRLGRAIHLDREDFIGRAEYGGAAVARFAPAERRREIALAWGAAWSASVDAESIPSLVLAGEAATEKLDELTRLHDALKAHPRRRTSTKAAASTHGAAEPPKIEVRRLKPLPETFSYTVELRSADEGAAKGPQGSKRKPLRSTPRNKPTEPQKPGPAPATAHRRYDQKELQDRAWAYVVSALENGTIPLTDLQRERGVGADGTINWKTFVEMKCSARETPPSVSLTSMEFQRARDAKGDFLLVVVSGLEEGFDVQLQIFVDPLRTLPWITSGSVSVGGLARGRALVVRQGTGE